MFLPVDVSAENHEILLKLDDTQRRELVRRCVQSILVLGAHQTPIKRLDLNKLFAPSSNYKIQGAVLQAANKELHERFGQRLFETDDKTKYLLVSRSTEFNSYSRELTSQDKQESVILYFILVGIFTSVDEKLSTDEVTKALKPYIETFSISNTAFKSYIDALKGKLYLTVEKRDETIFYKWGPRAYAEFEPTKFFNSSFKLADTTAKEWPDLLARVELLKRHHRP